jgi:hypothetical protein
LSYDDDDDDDDDGDGSYRIFWAKYVLDIILST